MSNAEFRQRLSTLRSDFLVGGKSSPAISASGAKPHAPSAQAPIANTTLRTTTARQRVIISSLGQTGAVTKDDTIHIMGPVTTYQAAAQIGGKRFMEYAWSKPINKPPRAAGEPSKRKKTRLPADSCMKVLAPDTGIRPRASSVDMLWRPRPHDLDRLSRRFTIDGRDVLAAPPRETLSVNRMYSESPSLGEPSADSVGNASVSDSVLGAMASQPVDDGDERRSGGSGTRLGEDDSAESVVSITDIFDRRTRELEDCEVKFTQVQQTKSNPPGKMKKKDQKHRRPLPMGVVERELKKEHLSSELDLLTATLSLHSLTNQCGDELHHIWGLEKNTNRVPASTVRKASTPAPDLVSEQAHQDPDSPLKKHNTSKSLKIIKKELRKVHGMHKEIAIDTPSLGQLQVRSPHREEATDPTAQTAAHRKDGGMNSRILSRKALGHAEQIEIKGPKLVRMTHNYFYDFAGLIELCEIIKVNTVLTSLNISENRIQEEGVKRLLVPCLKIAIGRDPRILLRHLNLAVNDLRAGGMRALAPILNKLSSLQSLNLADNNIADDGATALAAPLQAMKDLCALNLDLNGLSMKGLLALQPSLQSITRLKSLDIAGNIIHYSHENSDGEQFMQRLMPSLCELTNLTHLGLASNCLMLGGAKVLARVLGDLRNFLVSLDLGGRLNAHNRIGAQGMAALSGGLFWTPLVVLDMSFNDLEAEGSEKLALVLSIHTSLTEISLRGNGMGTSGVRAVMGSLVKHQQLRVLDLADNCINAEGLKWVAEGLPLLTSLERLSLSCNQLVAANTKDVLRTGSVSYQGTDLFTNNMLDSHLLTQIKSLDLRQSGLDQASMRGIVQIVRNSTTLQVLNGLDLIPSEISLPQKLDNYELLFVSQRLVDLEGPPGMNLGRSGLQRTRSHRTTSDDRTAPPPEVACKRKVDLTEFSSIDLSCCGFDTFPDALVRLRNLRQIDLSGNNLLSVPMKTLKAFASLHDIILTECPQLLHPPRVVATQNHAVEYLRECKLQEKNWTLPLVISGESDEILEAFAAPIKGLASQEPARPVDHLYQPQDTPHDINDGKASLPLPTEIRWTPCDPRRTFSLLLVSGSTKATSCRPFVYVQRAINIYVIRAVGGTGSSIKEGMLEYFDMIYEMNKRAVVLVVIAHDSEADQSDLKHRLELVESVQNQWVKKIRDADQDFLPDPCLIFEPPQCIDLGNQKSYTQFGLALGKASVTLTSEEGDWVHPVVSQLQDFLAGIAHRGHFWITWKIFFKKMNEFIDKSDSSVICMPTVVEVLHAKGIIRCVGPTKDPDTFEKPMLDTVFINTYKVAALMLEMPEESKEWKEWQVVEHLRSVHKRRNIVRRVQNSIMMTKLRDITSKVSTTDPGIQTQMRAEERSSALLQDAVKNAEAIENLLDRQTSSARDDVAETLDGSSIEENRISD